MGSCNHRIFFSCFFIESLCELCFNFATCSHNYPHRILYTSCASIAKRAKLTMNSKLRYSIWTPNYLSLLGTTIKLLATCTLNVMGSHFSPLVSHHFFLDYIAPSLFIMTTTLGSCPLMFTLMLPIQSSCTRYHHSLCNHSVYMCIKFMYPLNLCSMRW